MNKNDVLRDLEYLNGGIYALRIITKDEKYSAIFSEWQDIVINLIQVISKGGYEDAENA